MLKAFRARCTRTHVGLMWLMLWFYPVDGLIEIVEEQRCHDSKFRLTCRELDSHIAVLEAWYTSIEDYRREQNETQNEDIKNSEINNELNSVYLYSSPKHNGVYVEEPPVQNNSLSANDSLEYSDVDSDGIPMNYTLDRGVEFVYDDCGAVTFQRSYASWRSGDKRGAPITAASSVNLRAPLSYRCTGVNHCNFLLSEDYPPSVGWPSGVVFIKFACFDDTLSVHYCNRDVQIAEWGADSEGYIRTPGYPHFYINGECRWRLRVHPEQRVRVTLLDVSLRSIGPFENSCTDSVAVEDSNGDILLSSCEQVEMPLRLISTSNSVDVLVESSSIGAYPKRGVLLHYKSIGCVTITPPSNGYLEYRKEDLAHYKCNVDFVFADTQERARSLLCYDDNRWNDTVPICVEGTALKGAGNDSDSESSDKDTKLPPHDEPNMIVDIVIPSLLIAALFIGNAFIVLIIYKYRKRKNDDIDDEFNTIPLSVNGNVHSAGNAV